MFHLVRFFLSFFSFPFFIFFAFSSSPLLPFSHLPSPLLSLFSPSLFIFIYLEGHADDLSLAELQVELEKAREAHSIQLREHAEEIESV